MAAARPHPARPRPDRGAPWLRLGHRIGGTASGLLLALGIVLLVIGQSVHERQVVLDTALARGELMARVLEELSLIHISEPTRPY